MAEEERLESEKKEVIFENSKDDIVKLPEKYKPITMWGYFGYELLFTIPCIGFILICVFAFGGTQNINLRNFARSYLCFIVLGLVISLLAFLFIMIFALGAASTNSFGGF